MSRDEPGSIDLELTALETALGGLAPAASRVDRDALMFRAGAASVRAGRARSTPRLWPALVASLAVLALGEGVLLARRPVVVERVVVAQAPAPAVSAAEALPASPPAASAIATPPATPAGRLEWQLARYGLDALPAAPPGAWSGPAGEGPPSGLRLRERLLREFEPGGPAS
jgi:hypothetical protein